MISYMGGIVLSPVKIACAILTAPKGGMGSRVPTATKKEVEPRATQPLFSCGADGTRTRACAASALALSYPPSKSLALF